MDSMLNRRNITCNFRNFPEFQSERKRNIFNGLETLSYCDRASQLWTLLLEEIKQKNTINLFKSDVKHKRMSLQIMQNVCTKPRIYMKCGSYPGTIYDIICVFLSVCFCFLFFFGFFCNILYSY